MICDEYLLENLLEALDQDGVAAAYARQLPAPDCSILEQIVRNFNYPEEPHVRTKEDLAEKGIKTYFCSNVCAAYKRDVYKELKSYFGKSNLLFKTIVPRNIRLAEAPSFGKPCLIYDPESTGTKAYLKLAKEILERDGSD